ncbi:MAG: FxsA family protein [Candidatus Komeilibacteria bacterium]
MLYNHITMGQKILLTIILLPILELAVLIKVGQYIEVWNTIALVVITAVIGLSLLQWQGLQVWYDMSAQWQQGKEPSDILLNAGLILLGGILLLVPGFITDLIGLLLLWPVTRPLFKEWIIKRWWPRRRQPADVIEIKVIK